MLQFQTFIAKHSGVHFSSGGESGVQFSSGEEDIILAVLVHHFCNNVNQNNVTHHIVPHHIF